MSAATIEMLAALGTRTIPEINQHIADDALSAALPPHKQHLRAYMQAQPTMCLSEALLAAYVLNGGLVMCTGGMDCAFHIEAGALEVSAPAPEVSAPAPEVSAPAIEVSAPTPEVSAPAIEVSEPAIEVSEPTPEVSAPAPEAMDSITCTESLILEMDVLHSEIQTLASGVSQATVSEADTLAAAQIARATDLELSSFEDELNAIVLDT